MYSSGLLAAALQNGVKENDMSETNESENKVMIHFRVPPALLERLNEMVELRKSQYRWGGRVQVLKNRTDLITLYVAAGLENDDMVLKYEKEKNSAAKKLFGEQTEERTPIKEDEDLREAIEKIKREESAI